MRKEPSRRYSRSSRMRHSGFPLVRARLAARLLASLDEEPIDPDAERLWAAETERRAEELASGRVKGIPADKVLRRARAALR